VVPEVLAEHPFIDALDAARTAGFTASEWDAYILAGIAIQNERGALAVAEKRGEQRGREDGLRQGVEVGLRQGVEVGLRQGVEVLCSVLDIELTEERRRELANLGAAELTALLARLREQKSWT
jgi:hydroxypyruvate isomerase